MKRKKNKIQKKPEVHKIKYPIRAPANTPAIHDLIREVDFALRTYAESWQELAGDYEKKGLYDSISSVVDLKDGQLWVDFGLGAGNLVSTVMQNREATVVTVDNNPYLLEIAKRRLGREGHPINPFTECEMHILGGNPKTSPTYTLMSRDGVNYSIKDNAINILFDDLNDTVLLGSPFNERKADIVTYSFPGTHSPMITRELRYEDYHNESPTKEEQAQIQQGIIEEMGQNVCDNLRQILKPGGMFVYIARMDPIDIPDLKFEMPQLKDDFSVIDSKVCDFSTDEYKVMKIISPTGDIQKHLQMLILKLQYEP